MIEKKNGLASFTCSNFFPQLVVKHNTNLGQSNDNLDPKPKDSGSEGKVKNSRDPVRKSFLFYVKFSIFRFDSFFEMSKGSKTDPLGLFAVLSMRKMGETVVRASLFHSNLSIDEATPILL